MRQSAIAATDVCRYYTSTFAIFIFKLDDVPSDSHGIKSRLMRAVVTNAKAVSTEKITGDNGGMRPNAQLSQTRIENVRGSLLRNIEARNYLSSSENKKQLLL